jgi:serine/threonine-protein kinase
VSAGPTPDSTARDRIAELFARALERPPADRAGYLRDACGGAPELAAEVASLLAAHDAAGGFLDTAAARAASATPAEAAAGRRIGPFRLLREIGRGGMGVVFLAEREEGGFAQRVAVKLVKRGMDTDAILGRFLRERQILAALDHAHVARLLDGGVTEDGQPYFALEYVDGVPLTTYCDERRLGVDERLRLFEDACRAVQHAHGKLVVHRDLKPSNMLVTADGQLKLLDFGVAKLLGEDDASVVTRTGERLLTPRYGAPEQMRGEAVTTATDVYALGVVLYELLTGRLPHGEVPDGPALAEVVCEVAPPPPSAVVRSDAAAASARRLSPTRLARRLRGDLDTLVLTALRKEPDRRYASAHALAEDVRRHRVGLPVTARPDTLRYRTLKFVRRHRAGVAAVAVAAAALVGGLAMSVWQARIAARERDLARAEEAKARAVQEFLVGLFRGADPAEARGQEITARELLDRGAERVESQLSTQPAVQGALLHTIGTISESLGRLDQAQALQERALEVLSRTHGADHPQVASALEGLASLRAQRGDYQGAEEYGRRALGLRRLHPGDTIELAASMEALANVLTTRARLPEAEALFREALAMRQRRLGPDHPDSAVTLSQLGNLLQAKGDYAGAVAHHRQAIRVRERALGAVHPEIATAQTDLGAALLAAGDVVGAEKAHRDALAANQRLFGEQHPAVLRSLEHLAATLHSAGDLRGAEESYRRALALRRKLLGDRHTDVAITLTNLGSALAEQGRYPEAMPLFAEALAIQEAATGDETRVAHTLRRQAAAMVEQGRAAEARPVIERAIAILRARYPADHPLVARNTALLGDIHAALGQREAAETLYRQALDVQRRTLPAAHVSTIGTLLGLGELLGAHGRAAEAEPLLRDALRQAEQSLPEGHWRRGDVESALGDCLARLGREREARPLLERGHARLRAVLGDGHPATRRARGRLDGA